ncbi:uncharacterized protein LOC131843409 [Achroia grisella]|uniref:uncharacterized protein LOC131843409 n=1 Tax=Achroia grisella TaxID=688607 RepID=UPI0027D300B3|nr:uncharacterized protein LOC131843409 [Achroia grisella]
MEELARPSESEPLVPPLVLAVYIACVAGAGALANCSVLAALFKSARNGLSAIIIQLALADFALIGTSISPELWAWNARKWHFGSIGCAAYRGLNVFASTASAYLIVTIALHTLAIFNLEDKLRKHRNKRSLPDDDEMGSSRHSLVANSDSSTPRRTMHVDYRLAETKVPVTQPSAFIWVLSASLSVPEFTLAITIHEDHDIVLCTSVDTNHKINMQTMLAIFDLVLPLIIMTLTGALVVNKLKSKKLYDIYNYESIAALKLSLWLIIVYSVFCVPRSVASVYHVYSISKSGNEISPIDQVPKDYTTAIIRLAFSGIYLASTLIRPLLCIFMIPSLKKVFSVGLRDSNIDCV